MSKGWSYVSGDWWITCDSCGKKIKASESRKRWDGFIVCPDDYEERQPLDFIRARVDKISVPFTRPKSDGYSVLSYGLQDALNAVDDDSSNGDYIDPTYFAEDYIIIGNIVLVVQYKRDFLDVINTNSANPILNVTKNISDSLNIAETFSITKFLLQTLTDSTAITSSGTLTLYDYVEYSYFSSDYVGSVTALT